MAQVVTAAEPRMGARILSVAEIADAVVDLLEVSSLSIPFVPMRTYLPRFDLADAGKLLVFVQPGSTYATTRLARGSWQRDPQVQVVVVRRLATDPYDAECDDLMAFVEELRMLLATADLADHETWRGTPRPLLRAQTIDNDPVVSVETLETMRQFTSVLTITYRVID